MFDYCHIEQCYNTVPHGTRYCNKHTGGNDMTTERPDGTQGDLESSKTPAEALRQEIIIELSNFYYEEWRYDFPNLSPEELKAKCRKEAEETLAAYAATVEREARIDELKILNFKEASGFLSGGTHIVRQSVVTKRLAALQGPIQGDSK